MFTAETYHYLCLATPTDDERATGADWQTAELVRKKIEALTVSFVFGADEDQQPMAPVVQDDDGNRIEQFESVLIGYVRNSNDIKFNTPASTSAIYEWNRVQQHMISAGFRVLMS